MGKTLHSIPTHYSSEHFPLGPRVFSDFHAVFFVPSSRGKIDSTALWRLYRKLSRNSNWRAFRGWITMTIGQKIRAGTNSSKDVLMWIEEWETSASSPKEIWSSNRINSCTDAVYVQVSHFGGVIHRKYQHIGAANVIFRYFNHPTLWHVIQS